MSTNLQIDANRANAQHSTGPKTDEGKTTSSQNSFRHGLTGSTFKLLKGEDPQDFIEFANGILREHKPATVTEDALVTTMTQSLWRSTRAGRLQDELLEQNSGDKQLFALYLRYQTTHERAFSQALSNLIKLRKEARAREVGSVSQTEKQQLNQAKIRNLNARSAHHESTAAYRIGRAATVSSGTTAPVAPPVVTEL